MPEVAHIRKEAEYSVKLTGSVSSGEIIQLSDGRAAWRDGAAGSSGERLNFDPTPNIVRVDKTTGIVILDGGRVYWDHSANLAHYKPVSDRDFYIGRAYRDAASSDNTMLVALNVDPPPKICINRDKHIAALVGTQGLNTMGKFRHGGSHKFILSTTNEAQKIDMLSADGWIAGATAGRAIVDAIINVVSDGAGSEPDFNIGAANGTHATDFDSVTEAIGFHLDGNSTNISAFSRDAVSAAVAITDTTLDYTEGDAVANRVELWIDMRDPADCQLYVNGVLALGGSTFDVNGATGPWRLIAHLEKTASASVYEIDIERLEVRTMEIANAA